MRALSGLAAGCIVTAGLGLSACSAQAPVEATGENQVRLPATADVWLSAATPAERDTNSGQWPQLKLKNIQEMSLVRFNASAAEGREVRKATLYLHRVREDKLRYLRVSTVNQDWKEGGSRSPYGPPTGATYRFANGTPAVEKPWAWPGSTLADVIMTSGNSLGSWGERRELEGGWIALPLVPELIYAMVAGDTDGLAIMDGGNPANFNNFVHSSEAEGREPFILVELGEALDDVPEEPQVTAAPAPGRAHLGTGAVRLEIAPAEHVFSWRVKLDGEPVNRWRVKHPNSRGPTWFYLEDLEPEQEYALEVVAVSPGGKTSQPATLTVASSPALDRSLTLGEFAEPPPKSVEPRENGTIRVWPCPGLVKIDPLAARVMSDDLGAGREDLDPGRHTNAVWDGERIALFGARGEYVSYQLAIENLTGDAIHAQVGFRTLTGPGGATIGRDEIELYQNWYAQNRKNAWQPAYCVPIRTNAALTVPDPNRGLTGQKNQSVYVDVYIPRDAPPGRYNGAVGVKAGEAEPILLPVAIDVLDFELPDRLSFWPELNAYSLPADYYDYYRLAHQHRCVLNAMGWKPKLVGSGADIEVQWNDYDRKAGPLLTGEVFRKNRRAGVPVECMYLPYSDSWPAVLSRQTYDYDGRWEGGPDIILEHFMTAPYIGYGLSEEYKRAFIAVQRQFVEHFRERGYSQTEMQCFFGGKATHRVEHGLNVWWTTDEPYHWDDWLALQFFDHLWTAGRGEASARRWPTRADISRPQWQGRVLSGVTDVAYYGAGGFTGPAMVRRCRILAQETGVNVRAYGAASRDHESNTKNVTALLRLWTDGANAFLPWQTLGTAGSLDRIDAAAFGGSALLVPGKRFGLPVVGDMRLKAYRDAQQLIEYLVLLARARGLNREQIKAMLHDAVGLEAEARAGAGVDDADAMQFGTLTAWQITELRRRIAALIVE